MATQVKSGTYLPLRRQLQNTSETDTYYCRAVIRNSNTNSTLATVDLTDAGDYRFTYDYMIPQAQEETYLDVTVTVYTDSGYTQVSGYYGSTLEQYVIRNQQNFGGGYGLSYDEVERAVRKVMKDVKYPEPKEFDAKPLIDRLDVLNNEVKKEKKEDYSWLLERLDRLEREIKFGLDKLKFPETDIKPVIDALGDNLEAIRSLESSINNDKTATEGVLNRQIEATDKQEEITNKMKKYFADDIEEVKEKLEETNKRIGQIGVIVTKPLINDEDET